MHTEDMSLTLDIIINDDSIRSRVLSALSDNYNIRISTSFDAILSASFNETIQLVLAEQSALDIDPKDKLKSLKKISPNSQTLVLGTMASISQQILMLRCGARGYFDTTLIAEKLDFALKSLLKGDVWVERHVMSSLIDSLAEGPKITEEQRIKVESLSPKELEVANLVSQGATNKIIAYKMNITERTVKSHLTTIFNKLEMSDRLSVAIFFRELRE